MAKVRDVAAYILSRSEGGMTAMKLQKLVYYSQAWHLVWDEEPLFDSRVEAWANGPVVKDLYAAHRGQLHVTSVGGNAAALSKSQRESIDAVLAVYGKKSAAFLSELTHREAPWRDARASARLQPGQRGDVEITQAAMREYYEGLLGASS